MKKSDSIGNLATALAMAQGELKPANKDATNPFLKNKFADLGSVIEAVRPVLAKYGLSFVQIPVNADDAIGVETILIHSSGEWLGDAVYLPLDEEKGISRSQVAGKVITYLRRYALSAVLGVYADEDTDGNATGRMNQQAPRPVVKPTPPVQPKPIVSTASPVSVDERAALKQAERPQRDITKEYADGLRLEIEDYPTSPALNIPTLPKPVSVPSKQVAAIDAFQELENLVAKHEQFTRGKEVPEAAMANYRNQAIRSLLKTYVGKDEEMRHALIRALFNKEGLTACNVQELLALRDWAIRPEAELYIREWGTAQLNKMETVAA